MPTTVVVVKHASMASEFMAAALAAGYEPQAVAGLPRHFFIPGLRPEAFALADHPTVQIVDDGDAELTPGEIQEVTVAADGSGAGGWGAARIIRRDDPFAPLTNAGAYPKTSTFDCVRTGAGVDIYMIDAGCDDAHPEFAGRSLTNWWYSTSYYSTGDDSAHGTACMSVAAGDTVGVARESRLIPLKFYNAGSGAGTTRAVSALGAALSLYQLSAPDDRPAVLFFSWSGFTSSVDAAVTDLIDAGLVCCFLAGNDAIDITSEIVRPSESDPDTIVVGGIQYGDYPYYLPASRNGAGSGTNWSLTDVDVLAPAQGVLVARRIADGGGYRVANGTSFSTPFVAGVIACMLQGYKRLTTRAEVQALKAKLLANATTARLKPQRKAQPPYDWMQLPDRILYLDPRIEFEVIPGLTPRAA